MRYKKFPETVPITEDDRTVVVGWTGERSFVVQSFDKKVAEVTEAFDLDDASDKSSEDNIQVVSLWDWAIANDLSVKDLNALQDTLESYIDLNDEEVGF